MVDRKWGEQPIPAADAIKSIPPSSDNMNDSSVVGCCCVCVMQAALAHLVDDVLVARYETSWSELLVTRVVSGH